LAFLSALTCAQVRSDAETGDREKSYRNCAAKVEVVAGGERFERQPAGNEQEYDTQCDPA
jgi:hypothetical protein